MRLVSCSRAEVAGDYRKTHCVAYGGDAMARVAPRLGMMLAVLIALAPQANAGGRSHGGVGFSFGFGGFLPAAPSYAYYPAYSYYPPYSYAPPVAYAPPPAPARTPQMSLGSEVGQGCREYTAPILVDGRVVDSYASPVRAATAPGGS